MTRRTCVGGSCYGASCPLRGWRGPRSPKSPVARTVRATISASIPSPRFQRHALLGLPLDASVDDAEQDAEPHFKSWAGVGRMRRQAAIAAEQRTDIGNAVAEIFLGRPYDAEIDLVADTDLHRMRGSERVVLDRHAPQRIRRRRHLHRLLHRLFDHLMGASKLVGLRTFF